ncbi:MAG: endonuclease III [Oscillospiraceae bacterium]|nr:endonuclease III [Oscillospiraceae bacterium]
MKTKEEAARIVALLEREYPDATCSLIYEKDYELLFSVRLAAQCTDERVNQITPALFEAFPTLQAFADAEPEEVEPYVRSCGFFRAKAKDMVLAARMLLSNYGGKVPSTMEELLKLPGVGRKTANLILGDIYQAPGSVVVDTHCIRLSNRIGFVNVKEPAKIEPVLRSVLPPEKSSDFCHRIVIHGRVVCHPRKPDCISCCLQEECDYAKEATMDTKMK